VEEDGEELAEESFFCLEANTYDRRRYHQPTPHHNKKDTN
jgi:hypothetical protein